MDATRSVGLGHPPSRPWHATGVDLGPVPGIVAALVLPWVAMLALFWVLRPRDAPVREVVRVVPHVLRLLYRACRIPSTGARHDFPTTVKLPMTSQATAGEWRSHGVGGPRSAPSRDRMIWGMTLIRMDNVGIVVEDLRGAIAFFLELGMELEGEGRSKGVGRPDRGARRGQTTSRCCAARTVTAGWS